MHMRCNVILLLGALVVLGPRGFASEDAPVPSQEVGPHDAWQEDQDDEAAAQVPGQGFAPPMSGAASWGSYAPAMIQRARTAGYPQGIPAQPMGPSYVPGMPQHDWAVGYLQGMPLQAMGPSFVVGMPQPGCAEGYPQAMHPQFGHMVYAPGMTQPGWAPAYPQVMPLQHGGPGYAPVMPQAAYAPAYPQRMQPHLVGAGYAAVMPQPHWVAPYPQGMQPQRGAPGYAQGMPAWIPAYPQRIPQEGDAPGYRQGMPLQAGGAHHAQGTPQQELTPSLQPVIGMTALNAAGVVGASKPSVTLAAHPEPAPAGAASAAVSSQVMAPEPASAKKVSWSSRVGALKSVGQNFDSLAKRAAFASSHQGVAGSSSRAAAAARPAMVGGEKAIRLVPHRHKKAAYVHPDYKVNAHELTREPDIILQSFLLIFDATPSSFFRGQLAGHSGSLFRCTAGAFVGPPGSERLIVAANNNEKFLVSTLQWFAAKFKTLTPAQIDHFYKHDSEQSMAYGLQSALRHHDFFSDKLAGMRLAREEGYGADERPHQYSAQVHAELKIVDALDRLLKNDSIQPYDAVYIAVSRLLCANCVRLIGAFQTYAHDYTPMDAAEGRPRIRLPRIMTPGQHGFAFPSFVDHPPVLYSRLPERVKAELSKAFQSNLPKGEKSGSPPILTITRHRSSEMTHLVMLLGDVIAERERAHCANDSENDEDALGSSCDEGQASRRAAASSSEASESIYEDGLSKEPALVTASDAEDPGVDADAEDSGDDSGDGDACENDDEAA